MFRELLYMDHSMRETDLAEKVAERRGQSLAAASKPSRRARMARWFFAAIAGSRQAAGRA